MSATFFDELQWRGLVSEFSNGLPEVLGREKLTGYIGFDPTATSLHIGSLLPILTLARFQQYGHKPIAIAGGGTGLIGDPSGKQAERQLLTMEQLQLNLAGIKAQLGKFLDFNGGPNGAQMVDNSDWLTTTSLTDFLRDIGKHFTIGYMLGKESVRRRAEGDVGISFTEFSYMLLQAYDYLVLHDKYGCTLQMGGSDQWGNITAGMDLIHKARGKDSHALVFPLVTTSSGQKFGKTEAGAIWLDPQMTTPFAFFQFFLNTDDEDVEKYLKYFTFMSQSEIEELMAQQKAAPERRIAQRALAMSITSLVHSKEIAESVAKAGEVLFGGATEDISSVDFSVARDSVPFTELSSEELQTQSLADLLVRFELATSKSQAKGFIDAGSITVNLVKKTDALGRLSADDLLPSGYALVKRGKKSVHLIRVGQGGQ